MHNRGTLIFFILLKSLIFICSFILNSILVVLVNQGKKEDCVWLLSLLKFLKKIAVFNRPSGESFFGIISRSIPY